MSIRVETAYDHAHHRKIYDVNVRTKGGIIRIGRPTQGKKVAIRSFTSALRILLRGT